MGRTFKIAASLVAAALLAGAVWTLFGRDPGLPTAAAPRGAFASDRASEEATRP